MGRSEVERPRLLLSAMMMKEDRMKNRYDRYARVLGVRNNDRDKPGPTVPPGIFS